MAHWPQVWCPAIAGQLASKGYALENYAYCLLQLFWIGLATRSATCFALVVQGEGRVAELVCGAAAGLLRSARQLARRCGFGNGAEAKNGDQVIGGTVQNPAQNHPAATSAGSSVAAGSARDTATATSSSLRPSSLTASGHEVAAI